MCTHQAIRVRGGAVLLLVTTGMHLVVTLVAQAQLVLGLAAVISTWYGIFISRITVGIYQHMGQFVQSPDHPTFS